MHATNRMSFFKQFRPLQLLTIDEEMMDPRESLRRHLKDYDPAVLETDGSAVAGNAVVGDVNMTHAPQGAQGALGSGDVWPPWGGGGGGRRGRWEAWA